jgi:hypothetical protein
LLCKHKALSLNPSPIKKKKVVENAGEKMQISTTTMESSMEVTQKKTKLPFDPVISLLGIYLKEYSQNTIETPAHSCLLQHYSQQSSYGNSPGVLQLMNGLRMDVV